MTQSITRLWIILLGGVALLGQASCKSNSDSNKTTTVPNMQALPDSLRLNWTYNLERPSGIMPLPEELEEVSGLSYGADSQIFMLNDELGAYYIFSLNTQAVESKVSFALAGDYEGIELVGDQLFALRSDGQIFQMGDPYNEDPPMESFRTMLSNNDDTEGLGYDPQTGKLLIACKEPSRYRNRDDRWRAVYGYDIATHEVAEVPVLEIDLAEIKAEMMASAVTDKEIERAREFEVEKEKSFKPSAIAVHPITGHYYLLASAGKLIIVLNRAGQVIGAKHLPRNPFSQPEGICFSPEGDMFISNEARDGQATLLWFEYQPNQ